LFVPFSPRIVAKALEWNPQPRDPSLPNDWYFNDNFYTSLGYKLMDNQAVLPSINPFASGRRPPWAK
jgi:hypothetical protein